MKFLYLDIKNEYTKDNKYLAAITENGLWIKDEINENINIINAEKIDKNKLINVDILQFDKNFSLLQIIYSNEIDITNNNWHINNFIIIFSVIVFINLLSGRSIFFISRRHKNT